MRFLSEPWDKNLSEEISRLNGTNCTTNVVIILKPQAKFFLNQNCLFVKLLALNNNMPTVLLTGGTGMIGTHLQNFLLEKGYSIIVLIRNEKQKKPFR